MILEVWLDAEPPRAAYSCVPWVAASGVKSGKSCSIYSVIFVNVGSSKDVPSCEFVTENKIS
jgi:hypothetical protein